MGEDIPALFGRAGCTGQLCELSLDGAAISAAIGAAAATAVSRLRV